MGETPGLVFALSRVRRELHAALDGRLASDEVLFPLELTAAQLAIVVALSTAETVSSTDLCERVAYDAGAMTRILDRLQAKSVIRRLRSLEDRRVIHVELTEQGRAALPRMRKVAMEVADQFLGGFSNTEIRELESYLNRLLSNAQPTLK
jgi:DNA-binding MarR family transcriptional regulator